MFTKQREIIGERDAIVVSGIGKYRLDYTLECGQAFRYELIEKNGAYTEYMTVIGEHIITVGQRECGELIFYGISDSVFEDVVRPYFSLDTDYESIKESIKLATDSEWLKRAADYGRGIAILAQDEWETLFSFIVSQNNNIPRIRKILRAVCRAYGKNLAAKNELPECPMKKHGKCPSDETCDECGICYSFPSPEDVLSEPEKLLPSKPGFRYSYLLSAAGAIKDGIVDIKKIREASDFEYTVSELKKIKGVGDKVASCVALFGFGNLEAFPIDVWMKKAINDYFNGHLDPKTFGKYAGIAQQYIFHYIRNIEEKQNKSPNSSINE